MIVLYMFYMEGQNLEMNEAVRDFLSINDIQGCNPLQIVELAAKFFLVEGVKIGGLYRHFKGDIYEVTRIARDTRDWNKYVVEYHLIRDATHKASRPLEEFLDNIDRSEYKGPRFKLIG